MLTEKTYYNIKQIYPVSEGYLQKIPVERSGKYPEPLSIIVVLPFLVRQI
jgi:hypothetical protein